MRRAFQITGNPDWNDGLRLAVGWFLGVNDTDTPLQDAERGACFDGLKANGVNENRGAESDTPLITTLQHDRRSRRPDDITSGHRAGRRR